MHLGTVHVEPPVADEVLLVEERAVGAEEAVLEQGVAAVRGADVEGLTVGICVRVVPGHHHDDNDVNDKDDMMVLPFDLFVAVKRCFWGVDEYGVVLARHAGDVLGCSKHDDNHLTSLKMMMMMMMSV